MDEPTLLDLLGGGGAIHRLEEVCYDKALKDPIAWVAITISTSLSYPVIAAQMIAYGLSLGITSAPATESIMGAVSARQAGIGSAVNDATRLLGGTLGVAILGSVASSVYTAQLTD